MYVDSTKLISYNHSGLLRDNGIIWEHNSYILRMMTWKYPNVLSCLCQRKGAAVFWTLGLSPLSISLSDHFLHLEEMTQIIVIPWLFDTLTLWSKKHLCFAPSWHLLFCLFLELRDPSLGSGHLLIYSIRHFNLLGFAVLISITKF